MNITATLCRRAIALGLAASLALPLAAHAAEAKKPARTARVGSFTPSAADPVLATRAGAQQRLTPAGSVGTRGFQLHGGSTRVERGPIQSESTEVAVDYARKNWRAGVKIGSERESFTSPDRIDDERYSVEVGGKYTITRNVTVGAGMRYRVPAETARNSRLLPADEDGAAFLGMDIAF